MRTLALSRWCHVAAVVFMLSIAATRVAADPRTDYLVRTLQTSSEFRVRAQAALALGQLTASSDVTQALVRALRDESSAVRSAAASSLELVGDASSLVALRAAASDRDPTVRSAATRAARTIDARARATPPAVVATTTTGTQGTTQNASARYYVGVGTPGARVTGLPPTTLRDARTILVRELAVLDGVEIAPENEANAAATSVLRRRSLAGFFLDSSITTLESGPQGTRAVISVIVGTYPGRDMRAMLQGSATVPGATGPDAAKLAIEGAIRGALRRLPAAMSASAPTASR